ncbi:MAG: Rne/Rng family ribonuclease [Proteobacteria bacterium]|nr:Rne/Rng family ribonuclease [Pseudomonadota bacterium]
MYKELIVNVTENETRVALIEDGNITELFIERGDEENITGNIYKGTVQRVLPGMQAAFVDIGLKQAAFLYVDDVIKKQNLDADEPPENGIVIQDKEDFLPDNTSRNIPIEQLLRDGQQIMVQIVKAPIGTKGARVSMYISIPGRYLVLMPNVDHIGISKRINNEEERTRLKEILFTNRKVKYGYIFRTASEGIDDDQLSTEIDLLVNSWENIKRRYRQYSAPYTLHRDLKVTFRAIRDLITHEANKLIIDSSIGYESIKSFLRKIMPELKVKVELYDGQEPIYDFYNIEGDISRALKKKVWLKSGGYIVIEHTEALTSIDVNTGRYVGKQNFEETIFKTNLEAIKEIAYQIRLRNIGGIIILDVIDMENEENKLRIFEELKEVFKNDKSKTNILPMSEIGLIQMTRKRVRKSLNKILCENCPNCGGDGFILSKKTVVQKIYREINRHCRDMAGSEFIVRVNPEMADYILREESNIVLRLEKELGRHIRIQKNANYHIEEFEITEKIQY